MGTLKTPQIGEEFKLIDGVYAFTLGRFKVHRTQGFVVYGAFSPGPEFNEHRELFGEFERVAKMKDGARLGELAKSIDALDICAHCRSGDIPVSELRIY